MEGSQSLYLLYIRFDESQEPDSLNEKLINCGLSRIVPDDGAGSQFKNYQFKNDDSDTPFHVGYTLFPGVSTVKTLHVKLPMPGGSAVAKNAFDFFEKLKEVYEFDIIDMMLKSYYLEQLVSDIGSQVKLAQATIELDEELTDQSIIPLDFDRFESNVYNLVKRNIFFGKEEISSIEKPVQSSESSPTPKWLKWMKEHFGGRR